MDELKMIDRESTRRLLSELEREQHIDQFLDKYEFPHTYLSFHELLHQYLKLKHIKQTTFINRLNVTRSYAYDIINGQKIPSRDITIKIAITLKCDLNNTQKLLITAKHNPLHPKDKRDCVLIFSRHNEHSLIETNLLLYEFNQEPL